MGFLSMGAFLSLISRIGATVLRRGPRLLQRPGRQRKQARAAPGSRQALVAVHERRWSRYRMSLTDLFPTCRPSLLCACIDLASRRTPIIDRGAIGSSDHQESRNPGKRIVAQVAGAAAADR
jgi:hypothetical protein